MLYFIDTVCHTRKVTLQDTLTFFQKGRVSFDRISKCQFQMPLSLSLSLSLSLPLFLFHSVSKAFRFDQTASMVKLLAPLRRPTVESLTLQSATSDFSRDFTLAFDQAARGAYLASRLTRARVSSRDLSPTNDPSRVC